MHSHEYEQNKVLQWALGALIFSYFIAFFGWIGRSAITKQAVSSFDAVCPPYFQSCLPFSVLEALPFGYSQTLLYMLFFGALLWAVYLMSLRNWREVQLVLIPVFLWHFVNVVFFSARSGGNYEYYLIVFGITLLFLPHKEFFLKLFLVLFYFLSTVAKMHPSWIEGSYFTALKTGLPLFPDWSITFWTNVVIVMEMVGVWFLLSQKPHYQRMALTFFILFHLYSGILVQYRYPATVLPMILIAFGPWYRYTPVPLDKKSIVSWVCVMALFFLQFSPKIILGDEKLTLEGNQYGLYMFEANHQCISKVRIHMDGGLVREHDSVSISARDRCNPYQKWFQLKQMCDRYSNISTIEWTFDHAINGGPFLRIVDEGDVCELVYKPFSHNSWIRSDDTAKVIGWPVKNYYY